MGFLLDLATNVFANVVFWLLLGVTFWWLGLPIQRRFIRFFGLRGEMVVYLSNTWNPNTSTRTTGFAATKHELLATQSVGHLLSKTPTRLPELVRGLVDALWLRTPIRYRLEVSSPTEIDLETSTSAIVLGSALRNSVRRWYMHDGTVRAVLDRETAQGVGIGPDESNEILIRQDTGDVKVTKPRLNLAILEKVVLFERGKTVFFCVGTRGDSTWGATEYLVRNWRHLEREFGTAGFVICLGFTKPQEYPEQYSEPVVLIRLRT